MAEALNLTGAGVTLVHDGQQRFVTAAVDAIARLERVQENWQKGPCVDAVAQQQQRTAEQLEQALNTRLIIRRP